MADPPGESIRQFLATLISATSSSSNLDTANLNAAFAQIRTILPPNAAISAAQAPPAPPNFDRDPGPSLLRPSTSTRSGPSASQNGGRQGPPATAWLESVLHEEYRVAHALEVLRSDRSNAEIQDDLLDVFGFDAIEDMGEAVRRRNEFTAAPTTSDGAAKNGFYAPTQLRADHAAGPSQLSAHARDYTPGSQVVFASADEIHAVKAAKKAMRREKGKGRADGDMDDIPDVEAWLRRREQQLAQGPADPLTGLRPDFGDAPQYPHVYMASRQTGVSIAGQKLTLPVGTLREAKELYDEVTIPAPKAVPFRFDEKLRPISDMDAWGKRTFHAYETLNRLQSIVYPVAYGSNENMLVCAPTGAGKTDVALLTILRCLSTLVSTPLTSMSQPPKLPPPASFKIVYVAPLKALAAEVTLKFAKRLSWAGIKVRELTGDMKLTRKEVDETAIIVTTPEKWDVVTRRGAGSSDSEVAEKVKLLIIDEVHLLHEDRGAVIESIVARTLRQVESSQSLIRIVGLSATLPNYVDVADFLGVNRYSGLFFFDASFRPVPLEQHFVGVKGKPGSPQSRANLDNAAFDKVAELVKAGHQCMVFVHARKETVKTAQMLREKAAAEGILDLIDPVASEESNGKLQGFKRDLAASRNREMKDLANSGFGIHHAGMLRSDRNITERMFEANVTKVLCCTATLAWGVNLPAYAVVIKGTQVYDSGKGAFVDLSILDVLQIFGRAGRPQYEDQGVGYICTTYDKIDHYVSTITQQHPIESKFTAGMVDSLNAEISLGTVTNMDEGVRWLGYSYLFVRMRKNPLLYGMTAAEVEQDPLLGSKRHALINNAAKRLVEVQMVKFDQDLGTFTPTDLGRIAARYYIRDASIEIFNKMFRPRMSEADVLALISASVEFEQVQVRENEIEELKKLMETSCPCQVRGGTDSSAGKVNVLLQSYISKAYIEDFALVSDTGYVSQNAGRIVRALLDIALAKRWAPVSLVLLNMSKSIERRMWAFAHPLAQFDLPADLLYNIERWADDVPIEEVADMSDADFGTLVHQNERLGGFAVRAARSLPSLSIEPSLQPLSHDLLRVRLELIKTFEWSDKHHGSLEAFWVWVEDEDNLSILQLARVLIGPHTRTVNLQFTIPVSAAPKSLCVRAISDRWIGAEMEQYVDLAGLVLPPLPMPQLPLLDLPLLSKRDAFSSHPQLAALYSQGTPSFDPIQTQVFHSVFHSSTNVLLCTPSTSTQDALLDLAIWRSLAIEPASRILFIAPRKSLARHTTDRVRASFEQSGQVEVNFAGRADGLAGPSFATTKATVLVTSPSVLLRALRQGATALSSDLQLVIANGIEALDATYELAIARLRQHQAGVRVVAAGASISEVDGLADFLDVPEHGIFSFSPSARSTALETNVQAFTTPHSFALLRQMVKPAYDAARTASGPTIIVVPSRSQCRATASDLVTQSASDLDESFVSEEALDLVAASADSIDDPELAEALSHGIGVFHEGLPPKQQRLALELFAAGIIRVLLISREACWTVPVRASLVVVMSAQYVTARSTTEGPADREVLDYAVPDLLRMQSLAEPGPSDLSASFLLLCQKDQSDLYQKFFQEGVIVESDLVRDPVLPAVCFDDLAAGRARTRQDLVDALSWTYAARRFDTNPSYYAPDLSQPEIDAESDRVSLLSSRLVDKVIAELEARCAVLPTGPADVSLSLLGRYYAEASIALEEVERLQSIPLDDLMRSSKPLGNGLISAVDNGSAETDPALSTFAQRLPRAVKNDLGDRGETDAETWTRRVLLAAFRAGRIPRHDEGLQKQQLELVKRIVKSRV